jgi:hypothetical protein
MYVGSDSIDDAGDSIDIVGDWRSVIVASKTTVDGVDVGAWLVEVDSTGMLICVGMKA